MYLTDDILSAAREKYGIPEVLRFQTASAEREMDMIIGSQKHGRAHDITLFILHNGKIAVTAKHHYPPGMYRPPSGGMTPGESLEDGGAREAYEETGLSIILERYLLRIEVEFSSPTRTVNWTSHVFTARCIGGEIGPHDHHEIREARWALPEEFPAFSALMRQSDSGGLQYRAFLQDEVLARLFPSHS